MVFRHTLKTWRNTWCIGIFLTILSILFNRHLFYIYYYFYIVGLVSLVNYAMKYIQLNENGITINCSLASNEFIRWTDIKSAIKTTYEKDNIKTVGGRVRFTVNQKEESDAILLELHKPLSKELKSRNVQTKDNGQNLLLIAQPEEGFDNLLSSINAYLKTNTGKPSDPQNNMLKYLNIIVFSSSLLFICINISKFIIS